MEGIGDMDVAAVQQQVQRSWVRQEWDEWAATCAPTYRFLLTPSYPELDVTQTLNWSQAWFAAFPDYNERVQSVYTGTNSVAYELIGSGTAERDLILAGKVLVACEPGREFTLSYAKALVVDARGLVTADRQYLDPTGLAEQVGR